MRSVLGALTVLVWLGAGSALAADDLPLKAFVGEYEGRGVTVGDDSDGVIQPRDLNVTIKVRDQGFALSWTTVTPRPGRDPKRASYTINFKPSKRESIYEAAMSVNMFGQAVPLDPMKGDPYVWARINGKTLTVYALHITDEGGYEMQVYDRTLTDAGLDLNFTRLLEGEPLKVVRGKLGRVK